MMGTKYKLEEITLAARPTIAGRLKDPTILRNASHM